MVAEALSVGRVLHLVEPLRDMFAALFFVAIDHVWVTCLALVGLIVNFGPRNLQIPRFISEFHRIIVPDMRPGSR